MKNNPELEKVYIQAMRTYIQEGTLEEVPNYEAAKHENNLFYLPHRAVYIPERPTTPCPIVFDANAKTPNNVSLNELLHIGPPLQNPIPCGLFMRT